MSTPRHPILRLLIDLVMTAGFVCLLVWTRSHPQTRAVNVLLGCAVAALVVWRLLRRRL